ncbi:hypothetical protein [Gracilibacillus thailandensis]|uniref:Pectate lyase superfamily protein domain-containing protein n=1 Tax=Gracilibacillus thailandensis TaxID=563735 RepID=A0A6N7QSS0_9BACI|nr:hypothetical protein [Gracilibacillus thailandensis]MRI65167.1 hypothetical protein [Gracilibacillus thailandensis]
MKLYRNGVKWDREQRIRTNDNWDMIENNFNNAVQKTIDEAVSQVEDGIRLNYLTPPVDTFADIETTHPNPSIGDAVGVISEGKVYRYNGTEWKYKFQIDPGPYSQIVNDLGDITQFREFDPSVIEKMENEFAERGVNVKWFGASGSDQSTTGSISSGSNELTVTDAIDFEVGQGILIEGAGPGGVAEVAELQITSAPTTAGDVLVTLDGISTAIAVDPAVEDTAIAVADKIRNTAFTGWTTGGTAGTDTVTFTCDTAGEKQDAVYNDNGTGATGTMTTTTQGARGNNLVTEIIAINGTTFTIADSANTDVLSASVEHDDAQAIQEASNYAKNINSKVFVPNGKFEIKKDVIIYTDLECIGTFVINADIGNKIYINRILPEQNIDPNTLGGLTEESTLITGLEGRIGTLYFYSTEELIKRTGGNPSYTKRETSEIINGNGKIYPPLEHTYDPSQLTVTFYPKEAALIINNLKIEVTGTVDETLSSVIEVIRSDVNVVDVDIKNMQDNGYLNAAIATRKSTNINFERPKIKGFKKTGSGYGITMYDTSNVVINNGNITECRHALTGRHQKRVFVNGGVYHSPITSPVDTHWADGFYIDNAQLITEEVGASVTTVCGKDFKIRNSELIGGKNLTKLRADTKELAGKWVVENCDWKPNGGELVAVSTDESSPNTFDYGRKMKRPEKTIIRDLAITPQSTPSSLRFFRVNDDQFPQTSWGTIDIDNVIVEGYSGSFYAYHFIRNDQHFDGSRETKIKVRNIEFNNGGDSCYIQSINVDATRIFEYIFADCRNINYKSHEDSFSLVKIIDSSITRIFETDTSQTAENVGDFIIEYSEMDGTNINGHFRIQFLNNIFAGDITSTHIGIDTRNIRAMGNSARTGTTGYPTNLDGYVNTNYFI